MASVRPGGPAPSPLPSAGLTADAPQPTAPTLRARTGSGPHPQDVNGCWLRRGPSPCEPVGYPPSRGQRPALRWGWGWGSPDPATPRGRPAVPSRSPLFCEPGGSGRGGAGRRTAGSGQGGSSGAQPDPAASRRAGNATRPRQSRL